MAANQASMIVTGLEQTAKMLQDAPKNVVARGFVRALDAGGQVIERALWTRTPTDMKAIANRAHGGKGPLIGGLNTFVELDSRFRGGVADVGFGAALGHIALWVEFGHRMVGHDTYSSNLLAVLEQAYGRKSFSPEVAEFLGSRGRKRLSKGKELDKSVPPKPFMRQAYDASAEEAIDAFAEALYATLKGGI